MIKLLGIATVLLIVASKISLKANVAGQPVGFSLLTLLAVCIVTAVVGLGALLGYVLLRELPRTAIA